MTGAWGLPSSRTPDLVFARVWDEHLAVERVHGQPAAAGELAFSEALDQHAVRRVGGDAADGIEVDVTRARVDGCSCRIAMVDFGDQRRSGRSAIELGDKLGSGASPRSPGNFRRRSGVRSRRRTSSSGATANAGRA